MNCEYCGKKMSKSKMTEQPNRRFCSRKCFSLSRVKDYSEYEKECLVCGSTIDGKNVKMNNYKFCSSRCSAIFRNCKVYNIDLETYKREHNIITKHKNKPTGINWCKAFDSSIDRCVSCVGNKKSKKLCIYAK